MKNLPTPEALAAIPTRTIMTWPWKPAPAGYQYANTRGHRLLFHAAGCSAAGGLGLPPGTCRHCHEDTPARTYNELIGILDKIAQRRGIR